MVFYFDIFHLEIFMTGNDLKMHLNNIFLDYPYQK